MISNNSLFLFVVMGSKGVATCLVDLPTPSLREGYLRTEGVDTCKALHALAQSVSSVLTERRRRTEPRQEAGLEPDTVSYNVLIDACAQAASVRGSRGRVEEGIQVLARMEVSPSRQTPCRRATRCRRTPGRTHRPLQTAAGVHVRARGGWGR